MDDADIAQDRIDADLAYRLAQRKPVPSLPPSETCRNCERPLPVERQACGYCDEECRDEDEYIAERQKANR
jgi:hypothetical protein